jgi:uncharacterized protein (TIGR03435 family)
MRAVLIAGFAALTLAETVLGQVALPEFEVADIKPSKPGTDADVRFLPGGRLELLGLTMHDLVRIAYSVEDDRERMTGGPSWMDSQSFDVVAKANLSLPESTLRLMLRALLIERFKLVVHSENRTMPAYALTKGK